MEKSIYIILILSVLFTSCRELVQDEFPPYENRVTVNTIISAGDTIKVYIAYTEELNENPLTVIDNAIIKMHNQHLDDIHFIHQENGLYISDYIANVNDTLNLTITVPNKDAVTSSCVVPKPIAVHYADVDPYKWVDDEGIASPLASVKIKNEINNQILGVVYARIYSKEKKYTLDTTASELDYFADTIYRLDQDYIPIGTIDNINNTKEYLEYDFGVMKDYHSSSTMGFAFQIKLRTVDHNYYTYLNSIGAYEVGRHPDFSNSFIVPTNIYSNIENGTGIMCSYSEFETDTIF